MNGKLLIFDFDGTIVDTKAIYYRFLEKYMSDYGFTRKEIDKAIDLGLSIAETLKKMGFSWLEIWMLKRKITKGILRQAEKVKKCKNVDAIKEIKIRKILISNSISKFIFPVLSHLKLRDFFQKVYGAESFTDKEEFIKNLLKKEGVKAGNCFYIGDRVADIKVARKVKCKSIIVLGKCAWDSRKEVLEANPDYVVDDLGDIKKIVL